MSTANEMLLELYRSKMENLRKRTLASIRQLSDQDLNWLPNDDSNSIANLVLHLDGNIRQRIVSGIGGAPDTRDRDAEFSTRTPQTQAHLVSRVEAMFDLSDQVAANISPDSLLEPSQEHRGNTLTVLDVLFNTATHTSEHVGQIIYIGKQRLGDRFQGLTMPYNKPGA